MEGREWEVRKSVFIEQGMKRYSLPRESCVTETMYLTSPEQGCGEIQGKQTDMLLSEKQDLNGKKKERKKERQTDKKKNPRYVVI